MKAWDNLPNNMRCGEIKPYYDELSKHKAGLFIKRLFDIIFSMILIIILSPILLIISIWIKLDSTGPVMFRQRRVTTNGREFLIFKFRTMVQNAEQIGTQVTTKGDARITRVGHIIRKFRIDELPQLFNIFVGEMSFVGTRPEVVKYVEAYTSEMRATLLMPAGVTSRASIEYKDEDRLLDGVENVDEVYINTILPEKMKYNLEDIMNFSLWREFKVMIDTVFKVLK